MARVLDSFLIGLGMQTDQGSFSRAQSAVGGLATKIGLTVAAIKGIQAVFMGAAIGIASGLSNLQKQADRIGIAASELDKWQYVADQTNTSVQSLQRSMEMLTRSAGNAATKGVSPAAKAFKELGVNVKDSEGKIKNSSVLMEEVGTQLAKLDKAQQISIGQKLGLDRATIDTISKDLGSIVSEYDKMTEAVGISIDEAAAASTDFMDELSRFKSFTTMLTRSVFAEFILKMRNGFRDLRAWLLDNAAAIQKAIRTVMTVVKALSDIISAAFTVAAKEIGKLINWWKNLDDSSKNVVSALALVTTGIWLLNKAMQASPIFWIIGALVALLALYEDFQVFKEGGLALIDWGPYVDQIDAALEATQEFVEDFIKLLAHIAENTDFKYFLESLGALAWDVFNGIKNTVTGIIKLFKGDFSGAISDFAGIFKAVWGGLEKILKGIIDLVVWLAGLFDVDLTDAAEGLKAFLTRAFEVIGNAVQKFVDVTMKAINAVKEFFGLESEDKPVAGSLGTPEQQRRKGVAVATNEEIEEMNKNLEKQLKSQGSEAEKQAKYMQYRTSLIAQGKDEEAYALDDLRKKQNQVALTREQEQQSLEQGIKQRKQIEEQAQARRNAARKRSEEREERAEAEAETEATAEKKSEEQTQEQVRPKRQPRKPVEDIEPAIKPGAEKIEETQVTSRDAAAAVPTHTGDNNYNAEQNITFHNSNTFNIYEATDATGTAHAIADSEGDIARNSTDGVKKFTPFDRVMGGDRKSVV